MNARPRLPRLVSLVAVAGLMAAAAPAPAEQRRSRSTRKARVAVEQKQRAGEADLRRRGSSATQPTLEDRLREDLRAIWGSRVLRRGVTAIYVVDAGSGDELFAVHPDDRLNPASNVKLISTATVLDALGPAWRYTTRLYGATPVGGAVKGAVYLRGTGDPTLGYGALKKMAADLAGRGVRRVEGDVLLSDQLMRDVVGTSAVRLVVDGRGKPGTTPSVSVEPRTRFVEVAVSAKVTTRRRAQLRTSARIIEDAATGPRLRIEVGGTIRHRQRHAINRAVERRSTFTAHLLREALVAAGIEVTGRPRLAAFEDYVVEAGAAGFLPVELASHRSVTMADLVASVNKRSINWLADRLVMTAGAELAGEPPSMSAGLGAMKAWLGRAGLDPAALVVDTGSGLSYATKISARQLVRILRVATGALKGHKEQVSLLDPEAFRKSLAVGGVDGTLRGRLTNPAVKGQVVGKTGTLTGCVALAGLVSGGEDSLCFAIVTNGTRNRARQSIRHEHDQMVLAMRRYLEARKVQRIAAGAAGAAVIASPAPATASERAPGQVAAPAEDDETLPDDVAVSDDETLIDDGSLPVDAVPGP